MVAYGIIILAAGSSSRMGQPKQLLVLNGTTLLGHVVQQASGVEAALTVVVGGAVHEALDTELAPSSIPVIYNQDWEHGISSSIACGLRAILNKAPDVKACILMVCDQPHVSTALLKKMIGCFESNTATLVACSYADTLGTPALFGSNYFQELLNLAGQAGAKKIIVENQTNVFALPFPEGAVDIDTAQDYVTFISGHQ